MAFWVKGTRTQSFPDFIALNTQTDLQDPKRKEPLVCAQDSGKNKWMPKFTIRMLFALIAVISIGFAAPLEPVVYLMNIVFFASLLSVPIMTLWLIATPRSRRSESFRAIAGFSRLAIGTVSILFLIVLIRMEIMGQDF